MVRSIVPDGDKSPSSQGYRNGHIKDCCWDIFLIWLEQQVGRYPVTWRGLCSMFDDLELLVLSKKMEQLFL